MNFRIPLDELVYSFSRSGGAGGQNVNKVNSKATLTWAPANSRAFSESEKARLLASSHVQQRLNSRQEIVIAAQESRSQEENRELARQRLESIIARALTVARRRIKTKPTRASRERRLSSKSHRSTLKRLRREHE